jgi:hypothetical protein
VGDGDAEVGVDQVLDQGGAVEGSVAVTSVQAIEGRLSFCTLRDLLVAASADKLNVREFLIVEDLVESAVLTNAREFIEGGFVVEMRVMRVRHGSDPHRQFGNDGL